MNISHRLYSTILALSLCQISYSMNETEKPTHVKFRNSVITVYPAFQLTKSDPIACALNQFVLSLVPKDQDLTFFPHILIMKSNEWNDAPKINNSENKINIFHKDRLAILSSNQLYSYTDAINSIIALMNIAHEKKSETPISILITPPQPPIPAPITQAIRTLPKKEGTAFVPMQISGWTPRMSVTPTPDQLLKPQKSIERTTLRTSISEKMPGLKTPEQNIRAEAPVLLNEKS